MKLTLLALLAASGALLLPQSAHAAACANGVYRAGCVGPNGAAVVHKPYAAHPYYAHRPYASGRPVSCANGVYRAGCVGPNGAAVVRKPY